MPNGVLRHFSVSGLAAWDLGRLFASRYGSGGRMTPQSPNEALQPDAPPPPPPKPPSRRRPTLSALSGFMSFLVLMAAAGLAGAVWGVSKLNEPGPLPADKDIFIAPHTDLPDIIDKLETESVIDSPLTFNLALFVEQKRKKVRAGEYQFKAHASLRAVIDTLVSGKQVQQAITIPEGLTSAQIVERLRADDALVGEIRDLPKEGSLMPETYKFVRGSSRLDILAKMEALDRRVVEQIWARRAPGLPLSSPYELVILASIVEKETGKADERPRVAGVFINRLERRIPLASDPTIVYGLVAGQGTLGHSITRAELDKRTPYNTYHIVGLPPGPIDNPGRAALEAVANPSRTADLYFVADGTGGHVFAASLDEHNRNVQKWRQIQREAKDKLDVDKLAPDVATPPVKGNQRSDADPAFGGLSTMVADTSLGARATFADPATRHDIEKVSAAEEAGPAMPRGRHGRGKPPPKLDTASMTASLDSLGFSIDGVKPNAAELLDGPVADPSAPVATLPAASAAETAVAKSVTPASVAALSAAADPKSGAGARVAKANIGKGALDAPTGDHVDLFADPGPAPAEVVPPKTPPLHPKIYDASEGTPLDPLKDKSYDLNSGKTIPAEFLKSGQ